MTRRALKRYCATHKCTDCPVLDPYTARCRGALTIDGDYFTPERYPDRILHEHVNIPGLVPRWAAVSIIMATKAAKLLLQAVLIGLVVRWML